MKKIQTLLVLSLMTLNAHADTASLEPVKTPKSLISIIDRCEASLKKLKSSVRKRVNCAGVEKFEIKGELEAGEKMDYFLDMNLGYEVSAARAAAAIKMLENGMISQLKKGDSSLSTEEAKATEYVSNTMAAFSKVITNAQKGGHKIFIDQDADVCVGEHVNVVIIVNETTKEVFVLSHGDFQ